MAVGNDKHPPMNWSTNKRVKAKKTTSVGTAYKEAKGSKTVSVGDSNSTGAKATKPGYGSKTSAKTVGPGMSPKDRQKRQAKIKAVKQKDDFIEKMVGPEPKRASPFRMTPQESINRALKKHYGVAKKYTT